jgi:hypothetical protein
MAAAASHRLARSLHAAATRKSTDSPTPTFAGPDRRRWSTNPSLRRHPEGGVSVCRRPLPARPLKRAFGTRCRVVRRAPSHARRDDGRTRAKNSDVSHGVRCLSTESASKIVGAPTCLTGAFRSQGFSPSQRLDPFETSWLCFTPHPSPGFRASRAFSAQPAGASLDAACSRAVQVSSARRTEVRVAIEELRLQSLSPTEHSTPVLTEAITGRCSPGLSPLRGLPDTIAGPKSAPHALRSRKVGCARPAFFALRPRVYNRTWRRLGEPPQPP